MTSGDDTFDIVIVGGGITGVCLALESSRLGMRALLLDRAQFGAATSANSLRIIHGGMRYLQTLDLLRFRESVREQVWFLTTFPGHVEPLQCVMPLYSELARRPATFRAGLLMNRTLRRSVLGAGHDPLPPGAVLDAAGTLAAVPTLAAQGLRGGGVWFDAKMSSDRLLDHVLERAVTAGAVALDRMDASRLLLERARVVGVEANDASGGVRRFSAPFVVNATGPWSDEVAARFTGRRLPGFALTLAFNLVINRRPISTSALAIRDPVVRQTLFVLPESDHIVAGTWYVPWPADSPASGMMDAAAAAAGVMIDALNRALPSLRVTIQDVTAVQAGLLPARAPGASVPSDRAAVHDHARVGGPAGLVTVIGIKYTTARALARRALQSIRPDNTASA